MNSVFSAFKSSKSDGSIQSNKTKKLGPANSSSYANLRHIREIGSSAKMSSFVVNNDEDDLAINLRINKCTALHSTPVTATNLSMEQQIIPSATQQTINKSPTPTKTIETNHEYEENDCFKLSNTVTNHCTPTEKLSHENVHSGMATPSSNSIEHDDNFYKKNSIIKPNIPSNDLQKTEQSVIVTTIETPTAVDASTSFANKITQSMNSIEHNQNHNSISSNCVPIINVPSTNSSDTVISSCINDPSDIDDNDDGGNHINNIVDNDKQHTPVLSAASNKKLNRPNDSTVTTIMPQTSPATTITSNKTTSNRFYKRLSLSGIANNPLPSVHGRSTNTQNTTNGSCGTGETKRTRISTHQRNLSLDFR